MLRGVSQRLRGVSQRLRGVSQRLRGYITRRTNDVHYKGDCLVYFVIMAALLDPGFCLFSFQSPAHRYNTKPDQSNDFDKNVCKQA